MLSKETIKQLGYSTKARDVRVRSCLVNSVYIHKPLQCLQIADNLAVPVNPRFAPFPERPIAIAVGVVLVEGLNFGGGSMER